LQDLSNRGGFRNRDRNPIILLAMGVDDGPRQTLTGLAGCEDKLSRKRLAELLKEAGREDAVFTDLFDRIDLMRQRRPE
jgi:hypothetical protein